ncbi:hypothetical protein V496_02039 [Pseudogymnoascus sp. VKM F-4515 (FW-2607)]|nr:hypothetical protein V496_02039 [Pseudogymnoascus sp. VKM F-4515 (FW-2607)]
MSAPSTSAQRGVTSCSATTRDRHADYFRLRNRADDKGFFFVCIVLYSCECSAVDAIHPTLRKKRRYRPSNPPLEFSNDTQDGIFAG